MKVIQEFREFIARGNVVDLAVGVIMGAAFGAIVNSLVNDVVMPPIHFLTNGGNTTEDHFTHSFYALNGNMTYKTADAARAAGSLVIDYGKFLNSVIEFFIISACVFALVKVVNRVKRGAAAAPPLPAAPTKSEVLLTEIRDLLKRP